MVYSESIIVYTQAVTLGGELHSGGEYEVPF